MMKKMNGYDHLEMTLFYFFLAEASAKAKKYC